SGIAFRIGPRQLRPGLAFPMAVVDFPQPVVGAVGGRGKSQLPAHDLHGLARPHQRTGDIVERRRRRTTHLCQHPAAGAGLASSRVVEGDVALALIALRPVPVGLAMADEIERDAVFQHALPRGRAPGAVAGTWLAYRSPAGASSARGNAVAASPGLRNSA